MRSSPLIFLFLVPRIAPLVFLHPRVGLWFAAPLVLLLLLHPGIGLWFAPGWLLLWLAPGILRLWLAVRVLIWELPRLVLLRLLWLMFPGLRLRQVVRGEVILSVATPRLCWRLLSVPGVVFGFGPRVLDLLVPSVEL